MGKLVKIMCYIIQPSFDVEENLHIGWRPWETVSFRVLNNLNLVLLVNTFLNDRSNLLHTAPQIKVLAIFGKGVGEGQLIMKLHYLRIGAVP